MSDSRYFGQSPVERSVVPKQPTMPHHNHDDDRVIAGFGAVHLSDNVLSILALVAAHDGVSPNEWLAQAVVRRGQAIGLHELSHGDQR